MTDSTPYNMPKEPGRLRAIVLATLVHALLFGLLWFGIRWQSETPIAIEAEVWDMQPREAAPRPKPQPEPEVKPQATPEPKPVEPPPVAKEIPKPPEVEQRVETPDIALDQEKKRIEEKRRLEAEKQKEKERLAKEREEEERQQQIAKQKEEERLEQEKLAAAKKKAEEERLEKEKLAAAKKKAEAEQLRKKLAEEKAEAERLRKERIAAEEKAAEKRHQENLERMAAQAGAAGNGTAPRAQGGRADSGYIGRVAAKIKSNTIYNVPDTLGGNPPVEYEVQLLPDGSLRGMRKIRPSGIPGFDDAVARAIERSAPFPPDSSGRVPGSFNVIHRPKDQ
jgi:colicin import membrane protein